MKARRAIPVNTADLDEGALDWQAVLGRTERMVKIVRTRLIHERFELDEAGAEQLIEYCRDMAAGQPDNEQKWKAVLTEAVEFFTAQNRMRDQIA
ncbi:hypothetical protein SAMN05216338_107118 [Bradyrhizobium sp. Rc2d]|uniref:hypothetical protein n=1 Tax=Bradyrhizobium sp. Rc2d TaxID=1855321 RepID=UPI00088F0C8C|nr:hypothetical protein [Bradyrhizobium sp. Rc2d]SDJ88536.1 hypothetical protein SAMN05216338_107118 [Bradyrhizobium sp. Rc2d]